MIALGAWTKDQQQLFAEKLAGRKETVNQVERVAVGLSASTNSPIPAYL